MVLIVVGASGVGPGPALSTLVRASVGSAYSVGTTSTIVAPLILAGLAVAIAMHGNLWNIGGEGQIYIGGLGAALAGIHIPGLPHGIHLSVALLLGALFGAAWGGIAGVLKAWRGVNEVIATLLLNFVAISLVAYSVQTYLGKPGATTARSHPVEATATLPILAQGTVLDAGIIVALISALAVFILFRSSTLGFRIRMVGSNPEASRRVGVSVAGVTVWTMLLSGALAGLAGAIQVLGVRGYLTADFSSGLGFTGIAVALLGLSRPLGVIAWAFFFGLLLTGGPALQRGTDVSSSLVPLINGVAIVTAMLAVAVDWSRSSSRQSRQPGLAHETKSEL